MDALDVLISDFVHSDAQTFNLDALDTQTLNLDSARGPARDELGAAVALGAAKDELVCQYSPSFEPEAKVLLPMALRYFSHGLDLQLGEFVVHCLNHIDSTWCRILLQ